MAIVALIQQTQTRRGLPLTSPGSELRFALKAWEDALKNVPDIHLSRAYEHAAENWDWVNGKAFTADAVADAYKILVVEDRQRAEADKRNTLRRDKETYRCWHCQDIGYQMLWVFANKGWYSCQRPCSCDLAPLGQRSPAPLEVDMFVRNKNGEYAQRSEIEKHGVPNEHFKDAITSK